MVDVTGKQSETTNRLWWEYLNLVRTENKLSNKRKNASLFSFGETEIIWLMARQLWIAGSILNGILKKKHLRVSSI